MENKLEALLHFIPFVNTAAHAMRLSEKTKALREAAAEYAGFGETYDPKAYNLWAKEMFYNWREKSADSPLKAAYAKTLGADIAQTHALYHFRSSLAGSGVSLLLAGAGAALSKAHDPHAAATAFGLAVGTSIVTGVISPRSFVKLADAFRNRPFVRSPIEGGSASPSQGLDLKESEPVKLR